MARSRLQQIQGVGAKVRRGRSGGGSVGQFLGLHTGRQAGRLANAQAGTEYNPEIRNLRSQAAGSRQRAKDIKSMFGQLAGEYGKAQEQGNEAFKTQQDAVAKQLAEASERSKTSQQDLASRDESFAKLVGGPVDTQGQARIAAAGAAAERARVTFSQLPAAEQANFLASLGGQRTAARLQGIEARKTESDRRTKILNDLAALRKEKGQARVANTEKIRESDRGYAMEQRKMRQAQREAAIQAQQAAASLAVSKANLAREIQEGRISAAQAQQKLNREAAEIPLKRRKTRAEIKSANALAQERRRLGRGGLTPKEQRSAKEGLHNAAVEAKNLYTAAKKPPKTAAGWAAFAHLVAELSEINPTEATRAVAHLRKQVNAERAAKRARHGYGMVP